MNAEQHTVLCVDDEQNILHALKRLLRKEGYRLLTAGSGTEGLEIIKEYDVHLVISDQRMPEMSGTEFLAKVREDYPEVIRIVLTGYTEVNSITESINTGHIYKFMLKPWNDYNLKLEIKQALEQYELMQANKKLHKTVLHQNEELTRINEHLEMLVQQRTMDLEIQNRALELSRAILQDLPIPIIGISSEMTIVLNNGKAEKLLFDNGTVELGRGVSEFFSSDVEEQIADALTTGTGDTIKGYRHQGAAYDLGIIPLSGRFRGKGVVMTLSPIANENKGQ